MNGLPLHPMLVHLPLALAALTPIAAVLALGAHLLRRQARGLFAAVVVLQVVLAFGAVAALRSGEAEEERVESVVSESVIEAHEEAAETFVLAAWVAVGFSLVPFLWTNRRGLATSGAVATLVAAMVVLGLGIRVGEAGAELVYRHGAAAVYVDDAGPRVPTGAFENGLTDDD